MAKEQEKKTKAQLDAEKAIETLLKSQENILQDIFDYSKKISDLKQASLRFNEKDKEFLLDKAKKLDKELYTQKSLNKIRETQLLTQNALKKYEEEVYKISNKKLSIQSQVKQYNEAEQAALKEINTLLGTQYKTIEEAQKKASKILSTYNTLYKEIEQGLNEQNKLQLKQNMLSDGLTAILGDNARVFKEINDIAKENPYLAIYMAIKETVKQITKILLAQNEEVTQFQKNLMVSGDTARDMRNRFADMERFSHGMGSSFETVKNMMEASNELAQEFGAAVDFTTKGSYELVKNQITLTKQLKMSGQEAGQLQKTMLLVGMNEKQFGEMVTKSTLEAKTRTGVTFNLKSVMADVSKLSAATTLSLMKNPKALADAVVKAKELGTTVEKMNAIADSLLDIESSIGAQFEASVLSGKNLNFERARELALSNNIAGATADILSQIGDATNFTKMNRVQQESIAKAVGMSRDELAGSLITQQNYNKLGKEARDVLDAQLANKTDQEKQDILRNINNEKDAYAAAKKISAQEKLNQLQEKFLSIVTNILAPLEPVVDAFAAIFEFLIPIVGLVGKIGSIITTAILFPVTTLFSALNKIMNIFESGHEKLTLWEGIIFSIVGGLGLARGIMEIIAHWGQIAAIAARVKAMFEKQTLETLGKQILEYGKLVLKAIAKALADIAGTSALSFGATAAIALASVATVGGALYALSDGVIGPDGGLVVSGAKGTYQLDKNDTVVAGTALGGTPAGGGQSSPQLDVVIQKLNQVISAIEKKSFDVYLDGKQVSKNIAFASSNKNSK